MKTLKKLLWGSLFLVFVFTLWKFSISQKNEIKTESLPTGSGVYTTIFDCDNQTSLTLEEYWPKKKGSLAQAVVNGGGNINLVASADPTDEGIAYVSDNGDIFFRAQAGVSVSRGQSLLFNCVSAESR